MNNSTKQEKLEEKAINSLDMRPVMSSYPTASRGQRRNSSNKLREILHSDICHFAERQQLIDDDKSTVEKFGFDSVAVVVEEARVLYLDASQVRLNNEPVTCITARHVQHLMHSTAH